MLAIRAAGREILSHPRDMSHPYGLFIKRDGFQGWQGISSRRREALSRAVAHGEFDTRVFLGSRVVTVDGWVLGSSESDLENRMDSIVGLGGDGQKLLVTVEQRDKVRSASGRVILAEAEDLGVRSGVLRAEFQVQFVFPDPRKYGETVALPGGRLTPPQPELTATSIPVFHYGNFPAFPVIEIPSAPAGWTVTSPGGTFTVAGATAGGTHRLDLRNGRVSRNGVDMPGVGHGDLWSVPPGAPWTHTLSVEGRALIPDTFI